MLIGRYLRVLGQFAQLTPLERLSRSQHITANALHWCPGCAKPSFSALFEPSRALLNSCRCEIRFPLEVVVHAPLTRAGTLLYCLGTHGYVASFPQKFLSALDKTITRGHNLYLIVRTRDGLGKFAAAAPKPIYISIASVEFPLSRNVPDRCMTIVAASSTWLSRLPVVASLVLTASIHAQQVSRLSQPVPLPPAIDTATDTPYPGIIQLRIDATDVLRRIYQIHETIPVKQASTFTLLYPEWTPGDHAPDEPLEKLAGLAFTANGNRLHWVRDTVNVHAFSVDIPAGTTSLDVQYQYLGSTGSTTGPVLITPTMLDLQWQSVILYPAGHFLRDIVYQPSLALPFGWIFFTSLDGGKTKRNTVTFRPIRLDALIDQPVMAGRYLKQVLLTENPVPVRLDVAAQDPADLAALPEAAKQFAALMPQAYKLFGSHHYDHYDHMLFLSDEISTYFEHHRSSENARAANFLRSTAKPPADSPNLYFLAHGYVHSWNGMYRRPAEMWTPNLNTPERDSMLWVFEGLTDYWADVLCARAGIFTKDDIEQIYSGLAASMTLDAGTDWRPLEDTNNDPLISFRRPLSWASWQRNMFDPYVAGEMVWLEADAIIRQQSAGKTSLDDFARTFFSGNDAGNVTSTYTFDDMVVALNAVQPYDWRGFFQSRLDDYGQGQMVHSIDSMGYKLVFTDKPIGNDPPGTSLDLAYSLGMRVSPIGRIDAVHWEGPAFKAKLTAGETIVLVNGKAYDPEVLTKAITGAVDGGPLDLVVKRGAWQQSTSIEWRGGMRYPHLERIEGTPDILDDILTGKPLA